MHAQLRAACCCKSPAQHKMCARAQGKLEGGVNKRGAQSLKSIKTPAGDSYNQIKSSKSLLILLVTIKSLHLVQKMFLNFTLLSCPR